MTYDDLLRYYGTQKAAAEALGISQPSLCEWKDNDRIPEPRQAQYELLTKGKLRAARPIGRAAIA